MIEQHGHRHEMDLRKDGHRYILVYLIDGTPEAAGTGGSIDHAVIDLYHTIKDLEEDNMIRATEIDNMVNSFSAQKLHDDIMEEIGHDTGTTPGYSKKTMAKILHEIRKND